MKDFISFLSNGGWDILLAIIGFFFVRTLKQIDKNQSELYKMVMDLSKDFYELRGEHKMRMESINHE